MPYVKQELREAVARQTVALIGAIESQPIEVRAGLMNYVVTSMIHQLYKPSYANYNEAIGVLECIKLELYRRVVAKYEDSKIIENGDV